jgi:APA family basic amino acid/polyamine antiporter
VTTTQNTGPKSTPPLGRLFLRKSVEQMHAEHAGGELKKSLGAINLVLLGIGCIIGTGIFVLTGRAAANFAGPGIMISFVITGILCAFVALSILSSPRAIPVSGSAYSYSYASMGEFVAWIMGLLLLLEYGVAASTVAVGWSGYVVSLLHSLGVNIPAGTDRRAGRAWSPIPPQVRKSVWRRELASAHRHRRRHRPAGTLGVTESATTSTTSSWSSRLPCRRRVHRDRRDLCEPGKLVAADPRSGPAPPEGSDMSVWGQIWSRALGDVITGAEHLGNTASAASSRRCGYLLRLYRLRSGLDRRRRGEEPGTRHADRHHRLAADLHRSLHPHLRRAGWHRALLPS